MSGLEFWVAALLTAGIGVLLYVSAYRAGYTDGAADSRKWADR